LIKNRTALANQIRGLLRERGIVVAQAITRLRCVLPLILEDATQRFEWSYARVTWRDGRAAADAR
jgi:hypothetical protein